MLTGPQIQAVIAGLFLTLRIAGVAILVGVLIGTLVALGRISKNKILNGITWFYIWVLRGTPLLMQLFLFYYAGPLFTRDVLGFQLRLSPVTMAFIAYSLNSGAYLAETIRAAIQSIDKGQMEASKALGMSYYQAMFRIIIPQSVRRLIPPLGNEMIMLIKDTSLVASIALFDILRTVTQMVNASGQWYYYLYAVGIYLVLTSLVQIVFAQIEKKYSIYD